LKRQIKYAIVTRSELIIVADSLSFRLTRPMLETEREFFRSHCDDWMEVHHGEYALVKGDELVGFYDEETTAIAEGGRLFEGDDFLVRRVDQNDHQEVSAPALSLGLLQSVEMSD
jgi:hypothetical protein